MPSSIPGYDDLLASVKDRAQSSTPETLDELLKEDAFLDILHGYFGCQSASIYVHDWTLQALRFSEDVLGNGLHLPFSKLTHTPDLTQPFSYVQWPDEEEQLIRQQQYRFLLDREKQLTAKRCYRNLASDPPRRSNAEVAESWLLITTGERALFCFEWMLMCRLQNVRCTAAQSDLDSTITRDFVRRTWQSIYSPRSRARLRMKGRGFTDYHAALAWLREVLDESTSTRANYAYLWNCDNVHKNWFIRKAADVRAIVQDISAGDPVDYGVLHQLAHLTVAGSILAHSDKPISHDEMSFFKRSRLSPFMEMQIGSDTIIAVLLQSELQTIGSSKAPRAEVFLLGTFHDQGRWKQNAALLRSLLHSLGTRDLDQLILLEAERLQIDPIAGKIEKRENLLKAILASPPDHMPLHRPEASLLVARRYNSWYPSYFDVLGGCYAVLLAEDAAGRSRCIVIDPGFGFLHVLRGLGIEVADVDTVIVSHYHPDHMAGLFEYAALRRTIDEKTRIFLNRTTHDALRSLAGGKVECQLLDELRWDTLVDTYRRKDGQYEEARLAVFRTYHTEIGRVNRSLGLKLKFITSAQEKPTRMQDRLIRILGIVGDTSFEEEETKLVENVDDCHVVVLHLGSLADRKGYGKHLYLGGLQRMLAALAQRVESAGAQAKLVLISEFGLEHAEEGEFREITDYDGPSVFEPTVTPLMSIQHWVSKVFPSSDVLVADIGLEVELSNPPTVLVGSDRKRFVPQLVGLVWEEGKHRYVPDLRA